jgi:hypothetical protein
LTRGESLKPNSVVAILLDMFLVMIMGGIMIMIMHLSGIDLRSLRIKVFYCIG